MTNKVWEDFFEDRQTNLAIDSSEVFRIYANAELAREEAEKREALDKKLNDENQVFDDLEAFKEKVANDPVLRGKLMKAKAALEANPELVKKVDPNFINGLELLDI